MPLRECRTSCILFNDPFPKWIEASGAVRPPRADTTRIRASLALWWSAMIQGHKLDNEPPALRKRGGLLRVGSPVFANAGAPWRSLAVSRPRAARAQFGRFPRLLTRYMLSEHIPKSETPPKYLNRRLTFPSRNPSASPT